MILSENIEKKKAFIHIATLAAHSKNIKAFSDNKYERWKLNVLILNIMYLEGFLMGSCWKETK